MTADREALQGLRVVEFGHGRAGAMVGMILADFGAEVVAVRPPPSVAAALGVTVPLAAVQWDRGKRVVELDLRDGGRRGDAGAFVASADVVVDGLRSGVLARFGLGYDAVAATHPDLVYCTIRGSDDTRGDHELRGRDATVLAATGRMLEMGRMLGWDRPAYVPVPILSFAAAQGAIQGILAALHERRASGFGQLVRASLMRSVTPYDVGTWLAIQFPDVASAAAAVAARGHETPFMGYLTARGSDGRWVQFANWAPRLFWAQLSALGLGHLRHEPQFAGMPFEATEDAFASLWEQVLDRVATRPASAWVDTALADRSFGVELFRSAGEGMDHPQVRHNGDVVAVRDDSGDSLQLGPIARLAETPARIGRRADDGQSRAAQAATAAAASETGAPPLGGALAGITVLELATMLAGPFGPSLLAEQGARVVKVEPLDGDPMRQNPIYGLKTQQGKESLALDLKAPDAAEVVLRLASTADVVVENFRPGVADRLGVGYAQLRAANPRLVYVHASGYGVDGPYAGMPVYHPTPGAVCGNAVLQAGAGCPPDGTPPDLAAVKATSFRLAYANEGHPDSVAAMVVATAALLGLEARDRHGCGQEVSTSMLAANGYLMSEEWIRVGGRTSSLPEPDAELYGIEALRRLYRCSDGWILLECVTDAEWDALRRTMTVPALGDDALFGSRALRAANDELLAAVLVEAFAQRSADAWEALLSPAGVPCARADRATFAESLATDDTYREQEIVVDTEHPRLGRHWRHGALVRLSRTPGPLGPGTVIGQHTKAILRELGFTEEQIADLGRRGVVGWPAES